MTTNVIDALLITLGMDASGFKKGQKEASDAIKQTVDDANKAADTIEDAEKRKFDASKGSRKQRESDQKFIVKSEKKTTDTVEEFQKGAEKKVIKRQKDALGRRKKDNEETKRGDKEVEAHAAQAANFLGKFSGMATKAAGVVAAGIGMAVVAEGILSSDAAMSRLAESSGIAYDKMKAYATLAHSLGGSEDAGSQTIRNLVTNWQDHYLNGNNAQITQIRALGIQTETDGPNGKKVMRDPMDILADMADYASKLTTPEATSRLGKAGFNQDDARILHDLGRNGFKDAIEKQEKYNRISAETGKNAEELSRSFTDMNTAMMGLVKTLGSPAIKWLTDTLKEITEKASNAEVPEKASNAEVPGSTGTERGVEIAEQIQKLGWSKAQAAGMAGSIMQESGGKIDAVNSKSGAYGLMQLLGERVKDFEKWSGHALPGSSSDEQIKFMDYELRHGRKLESEAGKNIMASSNYNDSSYIHGNEYERAGDGFHPEKRAAYAKSIFSAMNGGKELGTVEKFFFGGGHSFIDDIKGTFGPTQKNMTSLHSRAKASKDRQLERFGKVSTSTNETNIGTINITTQATDAKGIASGLRSEINNHRLAISANTGIN